MGLVLRFDVDARGKSEDPGNCEGDCAGDQDTRNPTGFTGREGARRCRGVLEGTDSGYSQFIKSLT